MTSSPMPSIPDFSEAGAALLRQLDELAPWDMWVLGRKRADDRWAVLQATDNPWDIGPGFTLDWDVTLCSAMLAGAPEVAPDVNEVPAYTDLPLTGQFGLGAYVGVPIHTADGEVFGTVCGLHRTAGHIDDVAIRAMRMGAALMGTILDLEQRLAGTTTRAAEAEMRASHDPLTGLLNRRGFDAAARLAERHALAHGNRPAMLVLDLDGLKAINDTHGHGHGDRLLVKVAQLLRTSTPPAATVARIGGDEFLVLIDDCDDDTVDSLCQTVDAAMALAQVNVSIGAAIRRPGETIGDLIARADRSMYHRKQAAVQRAAELTAAVPGPSPSDWLRQGMVDGCHTPERSIEVLLDRARAFLHVDVLFVGRFAEGQRAFQYVSADDGLRTKLTGASQPLVETFCQAIVDGRLPRAIADAQLEPAAAGIAMTHEMGIGAHVGTPLYLPNGSLFGTICGASFAADGTINDRDAAFLGFLAEVVGNDIARIEAEEQRHLLLSDLLRRMAENGEPRIVLQPVRDLRTGQILGFEALARFTDTSVAPDIWFERAAEIGLGADFEIRAVDRALELLPRLPAGTYLAVNVSPALASSERLRTTLAAVEGRRVVVELTEHASLLREGVKEILQPLRDLGIRIAVDDAGSGYAGLQRLVRTEPDIVKIDKFIVHGVADSAARQAMIRALRDFSAATGAVLIAEGIERSTDRDALRALGVTAGQGHALGSPVDPETLLSSDRVAATI